MIEIFEGLKENNSVVEVDVSSLDGLNRNKIGHSGARAIERMLKNNHVISYLNLGGNMLGTEGIR
jgi:hypothetical protein